MRIGIITKIGKNYGALLQAYALKTALCDMGHEAHIIRYTPENSLRTYKICKYPWGIRGTKENIKALFRFKDINKSNSAFLNFREKYFDFIGDYKKNDEFIKNPPKCDIYITGSDQVWNPLLSFDSAYYFGFCDENIDVKRASYAASIGLNAIPTKYENDFIDMVRKFDYISVRETQGKRILDSYGVPAVVAPDPTLLLDMDKWSSVTKSKAVSQPYILCYFVSFSKEMAELSRRIQRITGYKIVNLMTSESSSSVGNVKVRDAGPEEFLGYFEKASFVLTSSFHGTVFSIINKRPFATILYKQTSSRVEELLSNLELESRIISSDEKDVGKYIVNSDEIYSENVQQRLRQQRMIGLNVLEKIVGLSNEK